MAAAMSAAKTMILAHRGASDARVENTLEAFSHAIERGADGVELDVQLSRDYEVMVFHDDDLRRLAGRHDRVETLTSRQLQRIRLWGDGRIPRLAELLERWPTDRWLNVELKPVADGHVLVERALAQLSGRPRVILSSFDPRLLLRARGLGSQYEHALLLAAESPPFLHAGGAKAYGCASVHLDHRLCTARVIEHHRAQGLEVGAWTVNDDARKRALVELGVTRLITDRP